MLPRLGITRAFLEQQVEHLGRFAELMETSAEAKAEEDRGKWERWLALYSARLGKEEVGKAGAGGAGWASAAERARAMDATNPKYILRNYIAENAIAAAEGGALNRGCRSVRAHKRMLPSHHATLRTATSTALPYHHSFPLLRRRRIPAGDFSEVQRVLKRLEDPFGLTDGAEQESFAGERAAAAASSVRLGGQGQLWGSRVAPACFCWVCCGVWRCGAGGRRWRA